MLSLDMFKSTVGYLTQSGNALSLEVFGLLMRREDVPLFYPKEDLYLLCGDCKGHSGGCPDYAPYFDQIKPSNPWLYVIAARIDTAWAIKYAGGNEYFRWSYLDRLTDSHVRRFTKRMMERPIFSPKRGAFRLVVGGCNVCKSLGYCSVVEGWACTYPAQRTYSIEAVGVDCSELNRILFGHRLVYWYYDGALPQYMVRYAGLLLSDEQCDKIDLELLAAVKIDKSYIQDIPNKPSYRLVKRVAPSHVIDAGLEYIAYEMNEDGEYDLR